MNRCEHGVVVRWGTFGDTEEPPGHCSQCQKGSEMQSVLADEQLEEIRARHAHTVARTPGAVSVLSNDIGNLLAEVDRLRSKLHDPWVDTVPGWGSMVVDGTHYYWVKATSE